MKSDPLTLNAVYFPAWISEDWRGLGMKSTLEKTVSGKQSILAKVHYIYDLPYFMNHHIFAKAAIYLVTHIKCSPSIYEQISGYRSRNIERQAGRKLPGLSLFERHAKVTRSEYLHINMLIFFIVHSVLSFN